MSHLMDKIRFTSCEYLSEHMVSQISDLEKSCATYDGLALKLECDYKLAVARESKVTSENKNEFFAWFGERLVGYIGISSFSGSTMEVMGMVEPNFRKNGIYTILFESVKTEWVKRSIMPMLLLTDRKSFAGQAFVKKVGAIHEHSEYEMILDTTKHDLPFNTKPVWLRKAMNEDAEQVAYLSALCFGNRLELSQIIMPEEEAKRGLTIYIAEMAEGVIGKVNLQKTGDIGAIYGLGIHPEFRGKGLGRALLLKAVETLKSDGFEKIMLQVDAINDTALGLYLSCGFEITTTMDYFELKRD